MSGARLDGEVGGPARTAQPARTARRRRGRRGAGLAALVALGSLILAPSAAAQAGIDFERCPDPEQEWECATHTVPLDHRGDRPGTVDLAVRRYNPPGSEDPSSKPPFFMLAGGPGQSAISVLALFPMLLAEPARDYQLVVFDQRGTGHSDALSCDSLEQRAAAVDPVTLDPTARAVAQCARQLGHLRAFHTTLDSVADIESLREALGAETIGIGGISYGTYVSAVYAQQHPERTDRLLLDSVVSASGDDVMQLDTFREIPRVVTQQCDGNACRGVTPDPLADLARLASQLRTGRISGPIYDRRGQRRRLGFGSEQRLTQLMLGGDTNPALRAGQPAAFRAAARGDVAPLLRFVYVGLSQGGTAPLPAPQARQEPGAPAFSNALFHTTSCTDSRLPWSMTTPPGPDRSRLLDNALASVPLSLTYPFGRRAVRGHSLATNCLGWPLTASTPPPEHPPFPDVPTLIVNGAADLRTPVLSAVEVEREFAPSGELMIVEGQGHSVLSSAECSRVAVGRFFADQPIGDPCAGVDEAMAVRELAPRGLRDVEPARGTSGVRGRAIEAVMKTLGDSLWLLQVHQGAYRIGGLRGGAVAFRERDERLRTRRLSYVPGVHVTGDVRLRRGGVRGELQVRGRRGVNGTVRFLSGGRVVGRIEGRRLQTRLGGSPRAALARTAAAAVAAE